MGNYDKDTVLNMSDIMFSADAELVNRTGEYVKNNNIDLDTLSCSCMSILICILVSYRLNNNNNMSERIFQRFNAVLSMVAYDDLPDGIEMAREWIKECLGQET